MRTSLIAIIVFPFISFSQPSKAVDLSLQEAEARALVGSMTLKAAEADFNSSTEAWHAQRATLYPRLTFDATLRHVAVFPTVNVGPAPSLQFGDNESYSIGPTLSFTLFDKGARRKTAQSLGLLSEAQRENLRFEKQSTLTQVRQLYTRLQLALLELQLVHESLSLSQTQGRDINARVQVGASSQLDQVSAEREILNLQLRQAQVQVELQEAAFDLYAAMGDATQAPKNPESLKLDPIDQTVADLDAAELLKSPSGLEANPALRALAKTSESAAVAVDSQKAAYWPLVQLQARASLDYPNGPSLEQIHQQSISLTLSMPLIEWGRTGDLVDQKRADAAAEEYRRRQLVIDVNRDWEVVVAQIRLLREQRRIAIDYEKKSDRVAKLNYQTYRAGRGRFIEVQNANLRLLEARVQVARVNTKLLNQVISLRALIGQDVRSE